MAEAKGRRRKSGNLGDPDKTKTGRLVTANLWKAPPGMYGDGGGLWFQVTNGGRGRSWIYRYSCNSKTREMGLGPLSKVSLAQARQAARKCWEMVHPIDPAVAPIDPFRARPFSEIGDFMWKLRECRDVPARALEFAVLTNLRIGSVRKAHKDEIDLVRMVWTVPPQHLKHRKGQEPKPLRVPLSAP